MASKKNKPTGGSKPGQAINSIYDLAKHTGLATSTISRVFNQRGRISMSTRQRVLAAAREAGFRPRMSARQTTVAVVLDRIQYSTYGGFIAAVLTHLIDQLAEQAVAVEVYTENNVQLLGSRFIDAVIALSWDTSTLEELGQLQDVPVVIINRLDCPDFSAVASDHHQGGRLVADYFLKHGHSRIAFLAEENDWGARQRVMGLRETLEAAGEKLLPELVMFTEHAPAHDTLKRLLQREPTALFLAGEDLALEATFQLTDALQVRIPEDLSVVGIENSKVSQYIRPPLTTLSQPLEEIARDALALAMEHVDAGRAEPGQKMLENTIIERLSVANLQPTKA